MNPENFRGYLQENFRGYTRRFYFVHPLEFSGDTCRCTNRKISGDTILTIGIVRMVAVQWKACVLYSGITAVGICNHDGKKRLDLQDGIW